VEEWYWRDCGDEFPESRSPNEVRFTATVRLYSRIGEKSFLRIKAGDDDSRSEVTLATGEQSDCLQGRISYSIIRTWLSDCDQKHGDCCKPRNKPLPANFRVIDCDTKKIIPLPDHDEDMGYTTLSYCWGPAAIEVDDLDFVTLPSPLPRLISDAILVTKSLGFRYLWIDRYCIPQGKTEENKIEKHTQIQAMDAIYSNSRLTLVAAAGSNPEYGLPGVSNKRTLFGTKIGQAILVYRSNEGGHKWPPYRDIRDSAWNSRGWTYQEWYLSPRKLAFTDNQVYFQCGTRVISDVHGSQHFPWSRFTPSWAPSFFRPMRYPYETWLLECIETVFSRRFTFEDDITNALSGIFSFFRDHERPVKVVSGLPIFSTISFGTHIPSVGAWAFALGWKSPDQLARRSAFPSWTWAGWKANTKTYRSSKFSCHLVPIDREQTEKPRRSVTDYMQAELKCSHKV